MYISISNGIKLLVCVFISVLLSYGALGKFEEHSRSYSFSQLQSCIVLSNSYTSFVLSKLPHIP